MELSAKLLPPSDRFFPPNLRRIRVIRPVIAETKQGPAHDASIRTR
jgi:hypothetical protein